MGREGGGAVLRPSNGPSVRAGITSHYHIKFTHVYMIPPILCSFTLCTSRTVTTGGIDYMGSDWDSNSGFNWNSD